MGLDQNKNMFDIEMWGISKVFKVANGNLSKFKIFKILIFSVTHRRLLII